MKEFWKSVGIWQSHKQEHNSSSLTHIGTGLLCHRV